MSDHVALYRKYRPTTFAEVRNQEHIVSVLEGAIKKEQIPHALLFAGTRGTGKTTLARIFARELGVSDVDLYEIDAASNRGIDDIRELKEAVHTAPYESPYKVYIIDEVHMLTKEAFNALLKTLEEPPAHVVFILATTEVEKLLDTILSRCQVFTMREPSRAAIAEMVTAVAKKEGFTLAADAAQLIAIAADGSFRDALSVTQKVLLASGDTVGDADEVAAIIGAPRQAVVRDLVAALGQRNTEAALTAIHEAVAAHADMKLLLRVLLERVRAVMLLRNMPQQQEKLLEQFGPEDQTLLTELANDTSSALNSHALVRLLTVGGQMSAVSLQHLPLEVAVVDITNPAVGK
jgi:DNA polymerase-3 subunit gamma/tau